MPLTLTYQNNYSDTSNASVYTFTGAAPAGTSIIVIGSRKAGAATSISSVTAGGDAATSIVSQNNYVTNDCIAAIYIVDSASGGDIVVTFVDTMVRAGIGVYSATGIDLTAIDTQYSTADGTSAAQSATISAADGGAVVGVCIQGQTDLVSETVLSEDFNVVIESAVRLVGASTSGLSAGSISPSFTTSGSWHESVCLWASFQPAGAGTSLFRQSNLSGLGSGGPFFQNPLG